MIDYFRMMFSMRKVLVKTATIAPAKVKWEAQLKAPNIKLPQSLVTFSRANGSGSPIGEWLSKACSEALEEQNVEVATIGPYWVPISQKNGSLSQSLGVLSFRDSALWC